VSEAVSEGVAVSVTGVAVSDAVIVDDAVSVSEGVAVGPVGVALAVNDGVWVGDAGGNCRGGCREESFTHSSGSSSGSTPHTWAQVLSTS